MNDYIDSFKLNGEIFIDNKNIYDKSILVDELRKNVGMVFQKPNPFPKSIFENVAYGLKIQGIKDKEFIKKRVKDALQQAALWDEVKDDLNKSALALSGGQQQRVCIARALAVEPSIILMDEPTSGLDPRGVKALRIVLKDLNKKGLTIILSSHVLTEVQEICSHVGIINNGKLIREESIDGIRKEIEKKSIRLLLKVKEFPEKISKELTKNKKIKSIKQKNNGKHEEITLELKEENIPWITDFLVSKGIQIFSIEPQKNSLEEIFLKETGGD